MRSEFEFLKNLRNDLNSSFIGDDCAILPKDAKNDLLITADLLIEDIDFKLKWSSAKHIGHKALAVSISDITAMGGTPEFSLVSIGIPAAIWDSNFLDEFYEAFEGLAAEFGVEIVGGDISRTPNKVVVDSIVLGKVPKGKAVKRSTAKSGDLIYVTGTLGGAAAGLKILRRAGSPENVTKIWQQQLVERQLLPYPANGAKILEFATSMIDISDGLSSDLSHICDASGTGAKIYADKIPIDDNLSYFTDDLDDRLDLALNGGEDFELLFTVDPKYISSQVLSDFHLIGEITETPKVFELMRGENAEILKPKGYTHF